MFLKNIVFWAYLATFLGVFGHATSEFFTVLSGLKGPEVSGVLWWAAPPC